MSVTIVGSALVLVAEGFVGFAELLELFLGLLVVRVFVWVIFDGQLAVSFFELSS